MMNVNGYGRGPVDPRTKKLIMRAKVQRNCKGGANIANIIDDKSVPVHNKQ